MRQVVDEVRRLIQAGQKRIVLDGLYAWTEYKILRKEFPGEMTVLALVVPKKLRYKRVSERPERPFNHAEIVERDRTEIENLEKGGPIAIADYYVLNDGEIKETQEKIGKILEDIAF